MGTRHLQTVIDKNGVDRVKQYGQWDGYPEGQGLDILTFLKGADLEKYATEVEKITPITDEQIKEHDEFVERLSKRKLDYKDGDKAYKERYYFLSRDCGAEIHQLIQDGKVPFVNLCEDGADWCEGFYTIDLQKGTFTSEFYNKKKTYKLNNLPKIGVYLRAMGVSKSTIDKILARCIS